MSNNAATVQPDVELVNQDSDESITQTLSPSDETTQKNDKSSIQMLSLSDAATHLGISVGTCRRWIKKGRIAAERVPITTGFVYRIDADVVAEHAKLPSDTSHPTTQNGDESTIQGNHQSTTQSSHSDHSPTHQNGPTLVDMLPEEDDWRIPTKAVTTVDTIDVTTAHTVGAKSDQNGHTAADNNAQQESIGGLIELLAKQSEQITALNEKLSTLHEQNQEKLAAMHEHNQGISNAATMYQTRSEMLEERLLLLQPPPPEVVEPEPKPRHRRWYWLWMRAT